MKDAVKVKIKFGRSKSGGTAEEERRGGEVLTGRPRINIY